MAKAILVLDEMPRDCAYCPCYRHSEDMDDCKVALRPLTDFERDNKPKWCPLKPIPERWIYTTPFTDEGGGAYNSGKQDGWNACIDELIGD